MIIGEKTIIRLINEKDVKELFPLLEQASFQGNFFSTLIPESSLLKKFQKTHFWQEKEGMMVILDKRENIVGVISFQRCNVQISFSVQYVIFNQQDQKNGIAEEALFLFSSYLFATKQIQRLQIAISHYHREAMAIAQKCGYKFEGIAKKASYSQGKYIDLCIYAMLKEECKEMVLHEKDPDH